MMHNHKCPSAICAHVWSHDDKDIRHLGKEVFDQAHNCPKCGREQFMRHFESEAEAEAWGKARFEEMKRRFEYLRDQVNSDLATDEEHDEYFGMVMELMMAR